MCALACAPYKISKKEKKKKKKKKEAHARWCCMLPVQRQYTERTSSDKVSQGGRSKRKQKRLKASASERGVLARKFEW
jgi:hypothetical protein